MILYILLFSLVCEIRIKREQDMVKTYGEKFLLVFVLFLISLPAYFSLSNVVASPAIGSITTTIYSVADAYVNSSSPDANYGDVNSLHVSVNSEHDFTYVRFNLSDIPSDANIISAKLKLYLTNIGGYVGNINTYYCSDNSWTELGVTWSNKPDFSSEATDERYFGVIVVVNRYYSWNVASDVQVALSQGNLTEVIVRKSSGYADFQSRECAHQPKLEVEYATKPVFTVHLESIQDTEATNNLGFITFADYVFSLPTGIDVVNGSYAITYNGGYTFVRWETTGGVTVSDENVASTTVTVSGNGTLRVVGNVKKLEYAYDYGNPQWHSESAGRVDAVRFTPLFSGRLLTARYYMYDLSSYQSNTFKVHVMNESRNDLITPFNVTPTSEGWFDVDLSSHNLTISEGRDFYVGMEWIVNYNPDLGEDRTNPSGRSWYWNGTLWKQETYRDFMIRTVVGTGAPEIIVGVNAGDWAASNDVYFEWASNWTGYEEPPFEMNMSWMKMEILEVHDTNITVQSVMMTRNGTVDEYVDWGDIETGEGNISIMIIPSDLGAGDEIPANLTWYTEEPLKLFINGTVTRNYAGANREVNYIDITHPITNGNVTYGSWNMSFYWDKKTGFLLEENVSLAMSHTVNMTHYYTNMTIHWRMTVTEMWPAVFTVQDGYTFNVTMESNSVISDFNFSEPLKQISFNVTGPTGIMSYCNVTLPKDLLQGPWTVWLNGTDWTTSCNIAGNDTHNFIYIPYTCSTNTIQIKGTWVIPEFSLAMILPLLMILTMFALFFTKKRLIKNYDKNI